jgi:hypothetical protein
LLVAAITKPRCSRGFVVSVVMACLLVVIY